MTLKHCSRFLIGLAASCLFFSELKATGLLYDFEGDSGVTATDKLTADGAQDGTLLGNISLISGTAVPVGTQAAFFDIPAAVNPPFSSVQVPGSSSLGDTFTLAVNVDLDDPTPSPFRIFSSYGGTGGVGADRILFDHQPNYIRAIVGGTSVTAATPTTYPTDGYHHYAVTVDSGALTLYFDGIAIGGGTVPTGTVLSTDLFVGEDANDLNGASNEQILGNIDDILVIDEALSPTSILNLANGASASTTITPTGFYAANYNFEGASPLADQFTSDGLQDAVLTLPGAAFIDTDSANAFEGTGSLSLQDGSALYSKFSQIETPITGTDLGDQFTLSSVINVPQGGFANDGLIRIFSTYAGGGSASNSMIVDVNPDADVSGIGIRFLLPGKSTTYNGTFSYDEDHTITTVYDNGEMSIYLDGELVKSATVAPGIIDLGSANIFIGEDSAGSVNENLIGILDDVLILDRAISPTQARYMALYGAEAMLAVPEPSTITISLCVVLCIGVTRAYRQFTESLGTQAA